MEQNAFLQQYKMYIMITRTEDKLYVLLFY